MALTQVPIELSSTPGIVDNSNTTAITIDSSENVLVGTDQTPATLITTSTTSHEGVGIADGYLAIARNLTGSEGSGGVAFLNRLATDGPILDLRKDGTTIGSIGVESGDNFIIEASATDHAGLLLWGSGGSGRVTSRLNGSEANGTVDLGRSASRWKNLYLSGGAYLGGTAAANYLDDYEEGTWTPVGQNINGSGYNVDVAEYTKVGRLVSCDLRVTWTGTANTGASIGFSLPFQSQNTTGASRTGIVFYAGTQIFSGQAISTHISNNGSNVNFYSSGGGAFQAVASNQVNGSYDWLVSFTYFTA